ncbi:MAG: Phage portal protein BeeE [Candidatus Midichloria mitochondrii]|nr:phage portal protein [Candidatus Midichloria mitochondrii]MDJ1256292.1 phage portal protein [Candidatus Midichloria mitochondrii]MDJ1288344.1 phage portal protein [Candidatus Midichloria mitochondrii]MDJ1298834.1 phage portal protein [Candidatus Midichloria mitochondrii]MDJ1313039.1 phage portal protein [Candidatus Midichloria mitochondrii]MDJ1583595.1 phage portal protein [Candidatus Midichloria mitochondrii]
MDFISAKHSSVRDIALSFGVPPQLLGIPGDNTYSNLKKARIALWEQTILPLADNTLKHLNRWLQPIFNNNFELTFMISDNITALAPSRQAFWGRIDKISFMTEEEKRLIVSLGANSSNS